MVKKLIQKDWYVIKQPVIGCILLGVIGLILGLLGNGYSLIFSGILLMLSLVLLMPAIVFICIIVERKEQNFVFLMSLPVSNLEYTVAKITMSMGVYFVFWLLMYVFTVSVLLIRIDLTNSILPYLTIIFGEILMFFTLLFATAIVTQSEQWTTGVMIIGNIVISCTPGLAPGIEGIHESLKSPVPLWNGMILGILGFEFLVIIITIPTMLYLQLRKKDFL